MQCVEENEAEIEVEIRVHPLKRRCFKVTIGISPSSTTSDVLETVKDIASEISVPAPDGRWEFYERWMSIERQIQPCNFMQLLNEWGGNLDSVIFVAREKKPHIDRNNSHNSRERKRKEMNHLLKEFHKNQAEIRKLRLSRVRKEVVSMRDPGRRGVQALASLSQKVGSLKEENKKLSYEVKEMNHEATRLTEHLTALRKASQEVVDSLTQLKAENQVKREREEKKKQEEMKIINESVLQVQQELEKRQRMTELQDNKIKMVQSDIGKLQSVLKSKQRELEQMREWAKEKKVRDENLGSEAPLPDEPLPLKVPFSTLDALDLPQHEDFFSATGDSTTSFESSSSIGSASRRTTVSIRRRFADFEEKTKHLLEDEGRTFRDAAAKPSKEEESRNQSVPPLLPLEDTDGGSPTPTNTRSSRKPKSSLPLSISQLSFNSDSENSSPVLTSPLSEATTSFGFHTLPSGSSPLGSSPLSSSSLGSSRFLHSLSKRHSRKTSNLTLSRSASLGGLDNKPRPRGILRKKSTGSIRSERKRGIQFAPEAIVLNAAWEGDFELLKKCIQEIGGCNIVSGIGVTCLHNAVCSGNLEMIDYLVQRGCDINIQDHEGWTPLHCAAAYSSYGAIQLLVKYGASLYLTTREDMTPVDIAKEEMEGSGKEEAKLCHQYLQEYLKNLGKANNGTVYALFSCTPSTSHWTTTQHHHRQQPQLKEMALIKGEKLIVTQRDEGGWWEVEDARGTKGVVPSSYLGLYPPFQVIL